MERLPSPPLVPSAMSGGNVIFSNDLAMTAPGSDPVDPLPPPVDMGSGLPRPVLGEQLPVNTSRGRWQDGRQGYAPFEAAPAGGWTSAGDDADTSTDGWEVA